MPATGKITQVIGSTFDAEFRRRPSARDLQRPQDRRRAQGRQDQPDRRSAAAPRRQPRPLRRAGLDRRPGPRHGGASTPARRCTVPVGKETLGRVFNLLGEPIDDRGPVNADGAPADPPRAAGVRRPVAQDRSLRDRHQGHRPAHAVRPRRQGRPVRRRGPGQDRHHSGTDRPYRQQHGGYSVFAGVGERTREGNDLWLEMQETKIGNTGKHVIDQTVMVFGQMNEPPGARLRVALSALTMAEWFRDETGADTLLFIDNIFRFTQAGSEVSALARPYAQRRRLSADAGHGNGRAAGTHHLDQEGRHHVGAGRVRARRRSDRPGPGQRRSRTSTRSSISSASIAEKGIYPAVDPLASASRILDPPISSARSTTTSPARCSRCFSATAICRTSSRSSASTN